MIHDLDCKMIPDKNPSLTCVVFYIKNPSLRLLRPLNSLPPPFFFSARSISFYLSYENDEKARYISVSPSLSVQTLSRRAKTADFVALLMAAIALSQPFRDTTSSGDTRQQRAKILHPIDINSADRMHNLCNDVGLKRSIIRMHDWPYEIPQSTFINGDSGLRSRLFFAVLTSVCGLDFSLRP